MAVLKEETTDIVLSDVLDLLPTSAAIDRSCDGDMAGLVLAKYSIKE